MNVFVIPISFHITTLAVDSFAFYTAKEQSAKLKISQFLSIKHGKILSLSLSLTLPEFPYIKMFFFLE